MRLTSTKEEGIGEFATSINFGEVCGRGGMLMRVVYDTAQWW
jgi:hypothetical protein